MIPIPESGLSTVPTGLPGEDALTPGARAGNGQSSEVSGEGAIFSSETEARHSATVKPLL